MAEDSPAPACVRSGENLPGRGRCAPDQKKRFLGKKLWKDQCDDRASTFGRERHQNEAGMKPGMKQGAKEGGRGETLKVIVQALLIALVVRTFLFQPFNIPSGSMIPTLLIGDYLFVSKYAYGYSDHSIPFSPHLFSGRIFASPPKRGDVVVFKLPRDGQTDYIKRVIGLPGDKIQMKEGRLYINDELVPREPIAKIRYRGFLRPRDRCADLSRDFARRGQPHDHRDSGRHRI